MTIAGLIMNLVLVALLLAALSMGWRLNRRLKALRDSHDGFAIAVRELNAAALRAEQGLADLRAATDEATDVLADRIEKGRALATKLERLVEQGQGMTPARSGAVRTSAAALEPEREDEDDRAQERRLGALLAAAREARSRPERRTPPPSRPKPSFEDELFEDAPPERGAFKPVRGGRS
ncbi:DUF6468 domain-containing protein [Phenylobacterium deserti]|uniref:Flagellar positioning protein PflI n=1 Tax=Phenylobacterium deserti TaxID=1914756 RepID=A0A328ASS3_9CAUL|nr:DUF6468 domain-containing protein [Phenylobacterium deserti]RAK58040.1 flagellar positioning protein PflI [Phenylobacterium deserti]